MAQSVEILDNIKGMARDFGIDRLPKGFAWDVKDYLPNRKGANIEQRGPWAYFGNPSYGNVVWGGRYTRFVKGEKLLVNAASKIWDVDTTTGEPKEVGAGPSSMVQNAVKLRDRVYFMDGQGSQTPIYATYDGANVALASLPGSAPKAKVGIAYKDRLVLAGQPDTPGDVFFSQLEIDGGPPAAWDPLSKIGTTAQVTGLAGMPGQILVFHPSMIERIRGSIPPGLDLDSDMSVDTLTDQVGCTIPQTIVSWRENIIWADERGVFQTDGSTVRNLIEEGGMGDFWRAAYGSKVSGASVSCGIFFDYLCVSIIVLGIKLPFLLVCDLNARTWVRFTNFPATCFIPSEGPAEEQFCGNYNTNRLMKVSGMFVDSIESVNPPPDYVDGNGTPVKGSITTGFQRLQKEEGLNRLRLIRTSYHHQSYTRALSAQGIDVLYRTTPPVLEEANEDVRTGWTLAGSMPDCNRYTRKKMPVGKSAFGIMVRIDAVSTSRTSRIYSIGVETTAQDRGKVTT